MSDDSEIMFRVEDVFRLKGRGGPILVGKMDGDGKLRVGDQLEIRMSGDTVILTIIGFDVTPAAAAGSLSLVVTGAGSDKVTPGASLRQVPTA